VEIGRRSILAMEVKNMSEMFLLWLIALVTLVVLLLIVAAFAPRGDREDRSRGPRHAPLSRRVGDRQGRKAA
jgi:hypothetical protein